MQQLTAILWSYANVLTKKRYDALLTQYENLDTALEHISFEMLRALGCQEETAMGAMNRLDELDIDAYAAALSKRSLTCISIEDTSYPSALRQIPDPPVFLYYKGSLDIVNQPCIGCVGSRDMNDYGRRVTQDFTEAFVQSGMVTVSGLAHGVDTEVARETLRAQGKTIAVVGHGLADIYPTANRKLAQEIVDTGGLLLSEYPLDMQADRFTFPARNRIIAGLSHGTVVLQAARKSGALITADLALEYGKDVFAVPGQVYDDMYAGCHDCIAKGTAKLASSPQEVLRDIGVVVSQSSSQELSTFSSEDREEQALYEALTTMPQSVSDLVEKAKLDAAIATAKLTMLELHGAAKNTGNGMWVKN